MRRRLILTVAAATTMVLLAMLVPMAVLLFCWPVLVYGFLRGGAEARTFLARRAA